MVRQNRASEDKRGMKRRRKVKPVTTELAGDQVNLAKLFDGKKGVARGGFLQAQPFWSRDRKLQSVQRHTFTAQMGQMQGNQHLGRIVTFLKQIGKETEEAALQENVLSEQRATLVQRSLDYELTQTYIAPGFVEGLSDEELGVMLEKATTLFKENFDDAVSRNLETLKEEKLKREVIEKLTSYEYVIDLSDTEVVKAMEIIRSRLKNISPNSPEFEALRRNLDLLRVQHLIKGNAPIPMHVAGDINSNLVIMIGWTFDDGPTVVKQKGQNITKKMEHKIGMIPGTWFIQRHLIEKPEELKPKKLAELKRKQDLGHEIGIHSVHPDGHHSWFPSDVREHHESIEDAISNLKTFKKDLEREGVAISFVRLPYGLFSEIKEYLQLRRNKNPKENAKKIINTKIGKPTGGDEVQEVKGAFEYLKAELDGLRLHLWQGEASGEEIGAQSWETESSGVIERPDIVTSQISVPEQRKQKYLKEAKGDAKKFEELWRKAGYARPKFEAVVNLSKKDKKPHSLIILAHDLTEADVEAVGEDVDYMDRKAKDEGIRLEYYTLSDLYRLRRGEEP